jgi:hypothetical protein
MDENNVEEEKEIETFDEMLTWFNELTDERRKQVMYEIEANIVANSKYKRKTMKVYFKDDENGPKIVGIENK